MSPITTHVLDISKGRPAEGVVVRLEYLADAETWLELGRGLTNSDGRVGDLLPADAIPETGTYRLSFDTAAYFSAQHTDGFYPQISIAFIVNDRKQHYHVPLLLSPFGYSTYRGS